jgi:hypothetical protein
MNVGILTFHFAYNYGAVLQAHGLCQTLKDLGHKVRFINYVPPGKDLPWWQGWGLRSGTELPARALSRFRFDQFRRRWFLTTRRCRTAEDLRAIAAEFDALIVGSDQVWNGNGGAFDSTYFLNLGGRSRFRRVSYAACFGDPIQPAPTLAAAGPLLERFDHLSVRNRMSARLVHELSGRTAETVVDPTLLHDYKELLGKGAGTGKYLAVYFLPRERFDTGIEVLRHVRERVNMPLVPLGARIANLEGDYAAACAGPNEWIQCLQNASFICTNSFHGTVFAVRFRKPFIVWSAPSTGSFRGPARIEDFLDLCGLTNRLVSERNAAVLDELLDTPIDFDAVSERLLPHISRSRMFLGHALTQE